MAATRLLRVLAGMALFVTLHSLSFADELLDRAKRLIETNQSRQAYELLLPLEPLRAGQIEFDYLLGVAAIESDDPQRAVFALERVIALNPNYLQARAEIARAYAALGERDNAKRELETVRRGNVPPEVRAAVDSLLAAIERGPTQFRAFLEATLGFDSNVNAATGSSNVAVPGLGTVVLSPGSTKNGDRYTGLGAGFSVVHPLSAELALIGGLTGNAKLNQHDTEFDTRSYDGNLGLQKKSGQETYTAAFQGQTFLVDNTRYRDSAGVLGQWQHNYSDTRQATVFAQYSTLTYPFQTIRNADRMIVGTGYAQAFPGTSYSPVVFGSIYLGQEKEKAPDVPWLGHKPYGIRFGGQMTFSDALSAFMSMSYEERRYGGVDPTFSIVRRDKQSDVRIGANYKLDPKWTFISQVSYTGNDSNIDINKFNRTLTSFTLRRDF